MFTCEKPDLIETFENESIELKQKGQNFWAICPFHTEKTASLKISPEKQLWYCHSCGKGGDVISFIRKLKNFSFADAIKYLDIAKENREIIQKRQRERERRNEFEMLQLERHSELCLKYRTLQKAKQKVKTEEDLTEIAEFYHDESLWLLEMETMECIDNLF